MAQHHAPLSPDAIASRLGGAPFEVHIFGETDSTMAECARRTELGAPEGTLIIAASQTTGRGTRGRAFFSPGGAGVYFSLLLRPAAIDADFIRAITPAIAVAAARAVDAVFAVRAGIKWVNDLILGGKKIAGLLAESKSGAVIAGVGINVTPPDSGFGELTNAGAITDAPPPFAREHVAAETARNLYTFYQNLAAREFLDEYRERSVLLGRGIMILRSGGSEPARAVAIDDDFGLVVVNSAGVSETLSHGEVSIRL